MVHVYITDAAILPDPMEQPHWLASLSAARKEKILRYAHSLDRKQSLGASLLLLQVLQQRGIAQNDLRTGESGKPETDDLYFNLSHSHGIAICAVGEAAVGCDVERIAPARERVIRRSFSPNEQAYLDRFAGEDRDREFTRLWTGKESYLKMTGEGLHIPLRQIEFSLEGPITATRDGAPCSCFIKEYALPGYRISVCSRDPEFAPELQHISFPAPLLL